MALGECFGEGGTILKKIQIIFLAKGVSQIASGDDGGLSGGSIMRRPRSEDPHQYLRKLGMQPQFNI